jgi:transposase-like protein
MLDAPKYAPCPGCKESDAEAVSKTWWGGILGPKMLKHVKCRQCGTTFNGETGNSNTVAIVIYTVVVFAICYVIGYYGVRAIL